MDKVIKIKFDGNSEYYHHISAGFNKMFLESMRRKFAEIRYARGYVYLNDIYEYHGIEWNPDNENLCFKDRESDRWPRYWQIRKCKDGTWNITIHYRPE